MMFRQLTPIPLLALLVVACAGAAATPSPVAPTPPPASTSAPATAAPPTAGAGHTVSLASDGYFVGPNGMTLYTFDVDVLGQSNCEGQCIDSWPPLTVTSPGELTVGDGLDAADFSTITATTGDTQVAFADIPLYYFAGDSAPGDTNGDGVGGVWHLATVSSTLPSPVPSATAGAPASSASPVAAGGVVLDASDDGTYLVDQAGMTLYIFDKDTTPGESACTGDCLVSWPPLSVADGATAQAGDGVGGTLDTITGGDGSTQVTYNGQPLYYFAGDSAPGDTTGDGVGGVWHLAQP